MAAEMRESLAHRFNVPELLVLQRSTSMGE